MGEAAKVINEFLGAHGTPVILGAGVMLLLLIVAVIVLLVRSRSISKAAEPASEAGPVRSVRVGKLHEQGAREYQQDCFGVSDTALMDSHGLLAVVADGMGGLSEGDKVSEAAVETIMDGFVLSQGKGTPEQLLLVLAQQAVEAVNQLLGPDGYRKSGSTLAMGLVRGGVFSFLTIGDSRICLLRNGMLIQLNREHVFQNELALQMVNGELSLQEVYGDSRGSGLTSFLGMGQIRQIDMPAQPLSLLPEDKLVLMSDGVYNALTERELTDALDGTAEQAAERLRRAIQEKSYSNQDNYTAVILECAADRETAAVQEAARTEGEAAPTGTIGRTETPL